MANRIWRTLAMLWRHWLGGGESPKAEGYVPPAPTDETLPAAVYAAELESIAMRRQAWGLSPVSGTSDTPAARHGLAGLAISGGGIRSATFNLGVVQAMARKGLLPHMDYLSTVSGGGYLGGCLSSVYATAPRAETLDIILSGLPEKALLWQGDRQTDGAWRVADGTKSALEVILPPSGEPQTVRLSAVARQDGGATPPAAIRPRGSLPKGVTAVSEQSAGGPVLKITLDKDAAATGATIPLAADLDCFPFHHQVGVQESAMFRHLRDNSNYLTPHKFLAKLRLPALFLRGILVNFLILIPLLLGASLTTLWLAGGDVREALLTEEQSARIDPNAAAPWLVSSDEHPNRFDLHLNVVLAGPTPLAQRFDFVAVSGFGADVWPALAGQGDSGTVVVPATKPVLPLVLRTTTETPPVLTLRAWKEAAGTGWPHGNDPTVALHDRVYSALRLAVVAALAILALYPLFQWAADHVAGATWTSRDWLTRYVAGGAVLAIGLIGFVMIQPLAIVWLNRLGAARVAGLGDGAEVLTMASSAMVGLGALFSGPLAGRASGLFGRLGLLALAIAGPLVVWLVYLDLCRWALLPATAPGWLVVLAHDLAGPSAIASFASGLMTEAGDILARLLAPLHDGWRWTAETQGFAMVYGAVGVIAFIVTRLFYDVNATSFHRFYRDRLSKAYLADPWNIAPGEDVRHNDGQKLSELDQARAPYHLINTTLNIQTSKAANLRGRNGAFFTMSRNFVGGPLTGHRATAEMEAMHPALDLGTAVAISGAAAAPNMGAETHRSLTFVLTLLNIRLGYWLPHPNAFSARAFRIPVVGPLARALLSPLSRVTPFYLLKEMLGQLDETSAHINLTDGGHLENLGIYELLRRRCRLIIACDGEADPDMTFNGLANAVRLARIDLGVNIEIDVDALRPDPDTGWSAAHAAVGRIHYGGKDYGYLIYIKSSMTGDEPVSIRKYRDDDPSFPHQTTADQFFDEAQFEAYRALGYHVGDKALDGDLVGDPLSPALDDCLAHIAARFQSERNAVTPGGQRATR